VSLPVPPSKPIDHLPLQGNDSAIALITRDRSLSYAELEALTGRVAAWLAASGGRPGDRVATWLPKTILACIMPLAAPRAGLIHVPVNPLLKAQQVGHILNDSGASLLITTEQRAGLLLDLKAKLGFEAQLLLDCEALVPLPPSQAHPDDLAALLYTSGSTGMPKGVMLSHANLWLGADSVATYLGIGPEDKTLAVLPLSFDYGQNQLFSSWYGGAAVAPLDFLMPRDVAKAVERWSITTVAGVPPLWTQLTEIDWPESASQSLRRLTNSGGALTPGLIKAMQRCMPSADIYPMYGLTEAFRSTYLDPAFVDQFPTSMGKPIPYAEILVIGPDGEVPPPNIPGELVHAGPLVAKGYWQDPERTAHRFRAAPPQSTYGGIAVWSGDTVRQDDQGLLYFVGRNDEMIKVSGNRISPTEIENAAAATGLIAECVAIGVPDPRLGQSITLVARALSETGKDDLLPTLKAQLPSFMIPSVIEWRDDLPRNANGKLDRALLKKEIVA
jgi:acyl-CoA ligase (AMP-forming) (exosortase A-associated)